TLDKKDKTTATLKVNLKENDYQGLVAEKVKEYSKKVSLKGFRQGKVPATLIEKMYGKTILIDEINHLLSKSINDYIKENKIQILGDPLPDTDASQKIDWENQKDFEFNYNIGLVPEFKYELEKLKINKYTIEVDEKGVKETVDNLRSQYGQMTNPEVSAEGDFIYGELKETEGTFTTQTLIPLNKLSKKELKNFVGLKKDDKIQFDIKKAFEDAGDIAYITGLPKEEAEKKEGEFELTVSNISRSQPAELNQDFFDKIFGKDTVKSEEEFNNKLKDTIQENYTREAENQLQREIQNTLVDNTSIEFPDTFLKKWLLISNEGKITEEQIEKEYLFYIKELKWTLIKNKIGEDSDIKVENEEVVGKTKELILQQFGNMPVSEEMDENMNKIADNYLKQEKGKNFLKIFEQVFFEKVLESIKSKVKIQEKKVSVDEFKKVAGF
ncbi:MAG: trigger factor, partial [Cytophagaceae bacterium]|nr:trigger factor [Cytophagaceae bacterium]